MSSKNKAKGYRWEAALAEYLNIKRIGGVNGANDQGDLADPAWCVEAKDWASIDLAQFMRELETEMSNSGKRWGIALVKRRRASTGEGYAIMPIWQWRGLRDYLAWLEEQVAANTDSLSVFKA